MRSSISASSLQLQTGLVIGAGTMASLWLLTKFRSYKQSPFLIPTKLLESPYRKELHLAVKLALKAGNNMKGYCESRGTVQAQDYDDILDSIETKAGGATDFCTQVDVDNETMIMEAIQSKFPNDMIIGEETSSKLGHTPPPSNKTKTWIIDPIDGTTNFASGLPLTCVSIGLCATDGTPVMGVVYAPLTQELFLAVKGYGAYRNGVPLLNASERRITTVQQAIICAEFGYPRDRRSISLMTGAVERILRNGCKAIRQLGSGVLDLCYVATGRIDAVYAGMATEGWHPWDYCAGLVICQEAGCVMEGIPASSRGQAFDLQSKSILCASTRKLIEDLRTILTQSYA